MRRGSEAGSLAPIEPDRREGHRRTVSAGSVALKPLISGVVMP